MKNWFATEGSPSPLGVTWIAAEEAFNFALYSKHATAVTLLLYAAGDVAHPCHRVALDPITNKSGRVWHCRVKTREIPDAKYYAYLVAGPNTPGEGHRFDDEKILFDRPCLSLDDEWVAYLPEASDHQRICAKVRPRRPHNECVTSRLRASMPIRLFLLFATQVAVLGSPQSS